MYSVNRLLVSENQEYQLPRRSRAALRMAPVAFFILLIGCQSTVNTSPGNANSEIINETAEYQDAYYRGGPFTVRLGGIWEGLSDKFRQKDMTGTFISKKGASNGKLTLSMKNSSLSCTGKWVRAKGEFNTNVKPQGSWSVICTNQLAASGTYFLNYPDDGKIEGVDNLGRAIKLYFE